MTPNLTDVGTHDFDFEFIFKGISYDVEGITTNTLSDAERCELGCDIPLTGDATTEIELLEAMANEEPVTDIELLKEIEAELINY